jgi:hypothetical protein
LTSSGAILEFDASQPITMAPSIDMTDDKASVPTLLLCGGTIDDRNAAIARLAEPVEGGHPVAVLRAGGGMFGGAAASFRPHVVVKWAPIGCLCCTAGVVFRVALFGLLHASRPARLVVDLGPGDHVATLEAQFQGESLGRVVRLIGRVDLGATGGSDAVSWPIGT